MHRALETLETDAGTERDVALHEARKAAKRARYAAESAQPVLGAPAKTHAQAAHRRSSACWASTRTA